jgi:hypothetical protein
MNLESYTIFLILCTPNEKLVSFRFFLISDEFMYKVGSFRELF